MSRCITAFLLFLVNVSAFADDPKLLMSAGALYATPVRAQKCSDDYPDLAQNVVSALDSFNSRYRTEMAAFDKAVSALKPDVPLNQIKKEIGDVHLEIIAARLGRGTPLPRRECEIFIRQLEAGSIPNVIKRSFELAVERFPS
ncbi:hypothetical protein BH11PSE11_BH11PSE11_29870 [soil metagenome]